MANVNIRVDDDLKMQAEHLFFELGLNMSTAMTMFLKQAVRYGGIPFDVRLTDPFYSSENQEALRNTIHGYQAGTSKTGMVTKNMAELEAMAHE